MSIRRKIYYTLASAFGLILLLAGAGLWASLHAHSLLNSIVNEHAAVTERALELQQKILLGQSLQRAIVLRAAISDRQGMEEFGREYRAVRQDVDTRLNGLRRLTESPELTAGLDAAARALQQWDGVQARIWEQAAKGDAVAAAAMVRNEGRPVASRLNESAGTIAEAARSGRQQAYEGAAKQLTVQAWLAGILLAAAMGLLSWGIWSIRGGLDELAGHLRDLQRMADEVTNASGSLSSTSQALADGATRQASSTEQTAASSVEVKSMAQRNSDNAKQAASIVTVAQEKFELANRSLGKLESTMIGLGESSSKIARIIKVIDDIAFQTNILSLNAAVEAARAGDAGMGFAVVADEVRRLAQRCASAAQETSELIHESIARSTEGTGATVEVAQTIRSITGETESIRELVAEVSESSVEQARAIDEIAAAVNEIERVTQASAANAEEAAAASEELTAQATELRHLGERLTGLFGVEAQSRVVPPSAPAPGAPASGASAAEAKSFSASPLQLFGRGSQATATADEDQGDFRPF